MTYVIKHTGVVKGLSALYPIKVTTFLKHRGSALFSAHTGSGDI